MSCRHTLIGCTIPLLLGSAPLEAQSLGDIRPGARIRIERAESKPRVLTGTLLSQSPDAVQLRLDRSNDTLTVPLDQARRLDVSLEQKSGAGRGASVGFMLGSLFGLVVGAACDCGEPGLAALLLGGMFGGVGTGVGALFGMAARVDDWQQVPLGGGSGASGGSRGGPGIPLFHFRVSF